MGAVELSAARLDAVLEVIRVCAIAWLLVLGVALCMLAWSGLELWKASRPHRRWRFLREVPPGERRPAGYGLCWIRWETGVAVFCPMPLNLLVAWGRVLCLWFVRAGLDLDGCLAAEAYYRGRADERAFAAGFKEP